MVAENYLLQIRGDSPLQTVFNVAFNRSKMKFDATEWGDTSFPNDHYTSTENVYATNQVNKLSFYFLKFLDNTIFN